MIKLLLNLTEKGLLPDVLIRIGIKGLCKQRLKHIQRYDVEKLAQQTQNFIAKSDAQPIAVETDKANEQHYELPTEFFKLVLGKHLKYSCCRFSGVNQALSDAEQETLALYAQRAQLADGQSVLDLGCGWGSMTLFMAQQYPNSKITAVSNSKSQKTYIDQQAKIRNLNNIEVITCDVNQLSFDNQFDRIISVEMLEHVSNHKKLFKRLAAWLKPEGLMFIHIFSHLLAAYPFEDHGDSDWMAKYFFSGGVMPSKDQFLQYQQAVVLKDQWLLSGKHYENTANAWLKNLDSKKSEVLEIFKATYGKDYKKWFQRWRIFFMACAELFGYSRGNEWVVSHYLFAPR